MSETCPTKPLSIATYLEMMRDHPATEVRAARERFDKSLEELSQAVSMTLVPLAAYDRSGPSPEDYLQSLRRVSTLLLLHVQAVEESEALQLLYALRSAMNKEPKEPSTP